MRETKLRLACPAYVCTVPTALSYPGLCCLEDYTSPHNLIILYIRIFLLMLSAESGRYSTAAASPRYSRVSIVVVYTALMQLAPVRYLPNSYD